jgi:hypothetical protein
VCFTSFGAASQSVCRKFGVGVWKPFKLGEERFIAFFERRLESLEYAKFSERVLCYRTFRTDFDNLSSALYGLFHPH